MKRNLQLVLPFFMYTVVTTIPAIDSLSQDEFLCKHSQAYNAPTSANLLCTPSGSDVSVIITRVISSDTTKEVFKNISTECNGLQTCALERYINNYKRFQSENTGEFKVEYKCLSAKRLKSSNHIKSKSIPTSVTVLKLSPGDENNWDMRVRSPALQISVMNCMTDDGEPCSVKGFIKLTSSLTDVGFDDKGFGCLSINTSSHTLNMSATYQPVDLLLAVPLLIYFKEANNCSEKVISSTPTNTMTCTFSQTAQYGQTDTVDDTRNRTTLIDENVTSVIDDTDNDTHNGTALIEQNVTNQDKGRGIADDDQTNSDEGAQDEVVIVVVAVLAVVLILVCTAVLIAKVLRKRRKRERPLLVKSQKGDVEAHDGLQNEVDVTAFPGDVTSGSRFGQTYQAAPDRHLLNTSLTDAIDLDGDQSDGSRPTSIHVPNQETNLKVAFERQLSPVSYESAFEGTLDNVVLELARRSQDSDSPDESLSSNVTQTTDGRDLGDGEENRDDETSEDTSNSKSEKETKIENPDQETESDDGNTGGNSTSLDKPELGQIETMTPSGREDTQVTEESEQEVEETLSSRGEIPVVKITQAPDSHDDDATSISRPTPPLTANTPTPPGEFLSKGSNSDPDYDEFTGWSDEDAPRSPREVTFTENTNGVRAPPDGDSIPTSFVMVEDDMYQSADVPKT
ncbi:uncharacterized protein LOC135472692 [Liolophura sinensis]|uniref:uncharacterized protein LOC135472692 n=1 Tax=Liolophura sinensis TaxID=3198878 RepID=UPI0031581DC8